MKEHLKLEIVKMAKTLLNEGKDIRHITMNLIAKRMDITAPTLYHYFRNKEEIIHLSLELIADEIVATFEQPFPASMDAEMRFKMTIVNLMSYLYKNIESFSMAFSDVGIGYWGSGEIKMSDKIRKARSLLEEEVRRYYQSAKMPHDPLKGTYILLSLMMGSLRYFRSQKIKNADIGKEAEEVFSFFVKGLKKG